MVQETSKVLAYTNFYEALEKKEGVKAKKISQKQYSLFIH